MRSAAETNRRCLPTFGQLSSKPRLTFSSLHRTHRCVPLGRNPEHAAKMHIRPQQRDCHPSARDVQFYSTPSSRPSTVPFASLHVRCHTLLPGAPCHRRVCGSHFQGALRSARCTSRHRLRTPVATEDAQPRDRSEQPNHEQLACGLQPQLGWRCTGC